ncbi:MAG TPA: tetratricopeptide repeat protein [Thermoanaerobaculia bacterium]|nr:tetratricopeptide repeat protein [Thermoanaerobaculia bacterium]
MPRALVLALLLAFPAFASINAPADREKWIAIDAGDLHVFSNASERETTEIATNLLRMREAIGRVTQLKVRSAVPTNVFVFRNEASFAPYRAVALGRHADISGLFLGNEQTNFILLDADAPGGIDRVVFHELTHYFVKNTLAGLPLWFHEGIAEYYSTFSAHGDVVDLGIPIKDHVLWLRDEPLIPLAQLFAMDTNDKDYNEGTRQGVFYAESWALMHYILSGSQQRHDQLPKFLALLNAKQPAGQAFQTAFDSSFDDMERELKSYVHRLTFQYRRYSIADLATTQVPAPRAMDRADVLYRLGDLLTRGTDGRGSADAERFLRAAINENAEHAGAYATLGLLHDLAGRGAEASVEYERAVKFGSDDPNVYLSYGVTIFRNVANALRDVKTPPSELQRARKMFEKASELAPQSARAYAGIGATYVISDEDPAAGIAALEKSMSLAPGQDDVAYNLVQLYARAGRRDDAQRLFDDVVAKSGTPEMVREAREVILYADVLRAQKLLQQEKFDEAMPILKSVLKSTTNAELKSRIESIIGSYESHNQAERQAAEINQAIDLANHGKLSEAMTLIDSLLPQITDAELRENTQRMRDEMVKASKQTKK